MDNKHLETMILKQEEVVKEIEDWCGDDFNPMDASGGNFDDAYSLGHEHGYEYGYLAALKDIEKSK